MPALRTFTPPPRALMPLAFLLALTPATDLVSAAQPGDDERYSLAHFAPERVLDLGAATGSLAGARPRSLAAADLDEDGVPDLIVGYATRSGGAVAVLRGNPDPIYPNAPEAQARRRTGADTTTPFRPGARVFALPQAADHLGAGDFDADGHLDVVAAADGASRLSWLGGDGRGALSDARPIALPGALTALVTGDVNRADGLGDVVAAVDTAAGARLVTFEGPDGAFRGESESTPLRSRATDLALGWLDDDPFLDVAAASGAEVTVVHGRDRKLAAPAAARRAVGGPRTERFSFPGAVAALATGDFSGDDGGRQELAALTRGGELRVLGATARGPGAASFTTASGVPSRGERPGECARLLRIRAASANEQLFVASPDQSRIRAILAGQLPEPRAFVPDLDGSVRPVAALAMRLDRDGLDDLVLLDAAQLAPRVVLSAPVFTYVVDSTASTADANLADNVCADANGDCTFKAALQQSDAVSSADLIEFDIPGAGVHTIQYSSVNVDDVALRTVTIDGTSQPGFAGTPLIQLQPVTPNTEILAVDGPSSVVRGLVFNDGAANMTTGISIRDSNLVIEGNFFGTNAAGLADQASGATCLGTLVSTVSANTIGGTVPAARNLVSGCFYGMIVNSCATPWTVVGNYFGADVTGAEPLTNSTSTIFSRCRLNLGGTAAGSRNVITGPSIAGSAAIVLTALNTNNAAGSLIQGNHIGVDVSGTTSLGGADDGILIDHADVDDVTIGGTVATARNAIGGFGGSCIHVTAAVSDLVVEGNAIGTGADTTTPLGCGADGIRAEGIALGYVGGTAAGAGNVIANNTGTGVSVVGGPLWIQRNSIYGNAQGIDLWVAGAADGYTANDAGDADGGATDGNGLQNRPTLTGASATSVAGSLSSTPSSNFTIDFYSSPECTAGVNQRQGRTWRGSTNVTTDGAGSAAILVNAGLASSIPTGHRVTATATDVNGNTSEFSPCQNAVNGTTVEIVPPSGPVRVGEPFTLLGGGFTNGSVIKAFVATSSGVIDVFPSGLTPSGGTTTSLLGTLTYPWPAGAPNERVLGNGFVSFQVVRTDQGFDTSNVVGAVLLGSDAQSVPSITALGGIPLSATSSSTSIRTANVEGLVEPGGSLVIDGSGFASPLVNIFTATGNIGPLTPTISSATSITVEIPGNAPVGPGSVQVINATGSFQASNAVSVPIGDLITVSGVQVNGSTVTVTGTGFNSLTVINFFASDGGQLTNFGGLDGGGAARIPLTVQKSTTMTFTRPAGAVAGAAFVEALNPPFIPFSSSGASAGGALTLP